MRVSARADYALRAAAELATAGPDVRLKRETLAARQDIPLEFLESVLLDLKHAGIVQSQRGASGGFRLARPPAEISLADVIRAVDGPMADVRGDRPERIDYRGAGSPPPAHLDRASSQPAGDPRGNVAPGPRRREPVGGGPPAHRCTGRVDLARSRPRPNAVQDRGSPPAERRPARVSAVRLTASRPGLGELGSAARGCRTRPGPRRCR